MQRIFLKCKQHPHLRWTAKSVAVNSDGSYNGQRHIFFQGEDGKGLRGAQECECPVSDLTFASDEEKAKWEEDK